MEHSTPPEPQTEAPLPPDIVAFCSLLARIAYRRVIERKAPLSGETPTDPAPSSEAASPAVPEAA